VLSEQFAAAGRLAALNHATLLNAPTQQHVEV
jgi:hypothetical protein